jgi:hypothetical protein
MAFGDYRYEGDDGDVYLVRMAEDVFEALSGNSQAGGEVTKPFHLETSDSRRSFGIKPRHIVATRRFGTPPNNGVRRMTIPILDPGKIEGNEPDINIGQSFTYRGNTWMVSALVSESEK